MPKKKIFCALGLLVVLALFATPHPVTAWANDNWTRYKTIEFPLDNCGENFQVKIVINYDADMKTDFSDIRFAENLNSATWLPYWIENYNLGDNAIVWLLRDNTDNQIFMYYGNAAATSAENGEKVFENGWFDTFNGAALDTTKWNNEIGTVAVAGSIATVQAGGVSWEAFKTNISFRTGHVFMFRANITGANAGAGLMSDYGQSRPNALLTTSSGMLQAQSGTTSTQVTTTTKAASNWYILEIAHEANPQTFYIDNVLAASHSTQSVTAAEPFYFQEYNTTQSVLVDWFAVRKIGTMPTYVFGAEQTYAPPPPPFRGLGKPTLLIPENNRDNYIDQNLYFEWSIGENSENSRLEVFDSLGVCRENLTFPRPENTYTKLEGYGADNYAWRVWAENKNNANSENESGLFHFEYTERPAGGTTSTLGIVFGMVGLVFFVLWISSRRKR